MPGLMILSYLPLGNDGCNHDRHLRPNNGMQNDAPQAARV